MPSYFAHATAACRYKTSRYVQSLLFFLAVGCGGRLIWIINWANWRQVMRLVCDRLFSHSVSTNRHTEPSLNDSMGILCRTVGSRTSHTQLDGARRMGVLQKAEDSLELTSSYQVGHLQFRTFQEISSMIIYDHRIYNKNNGWQSCGTTYTLVVCLLEGLLQAWRAASSVVVTTSRTEMERVKESKKACSIYAR